MLIIILSVITILAILLLIIIQFSFLRVFLSGFPSTGQAVGAGYGDYISGSQSKIDSVVAWQRGCAMWKNRGCAIDEEIGQIAISSYDYDKDGSDDSLSDACRNYLGFTENEDCWRACCSGIMG